MFNRKFKNFFILCMSFIVLFSGFYYKVNAAIEVSGNNSPKTAFEITAFPYTVNFKLDSKSDIDWFKIVVNRRGALLVEATGWTNYELYSESEMKKTDPKSITSERNGNSYKVDAGVYYIKLSPVYYDNEMRTLNIDLLEEDKYENNDIPSKATTINLGQGYNFKLNAKNDVDWFKVSVNRRGALLVEATGWTDYELYPESEVGKSDPKSITSGRNGNSYKIGAGTYYIKLSPVYYNQEVRTLKANLLSGDEHEDNDTAKEATNIILGKKYNFILNSVNDIDWFKVVLNKSGSLNINVSGWTEYDLYAESEVNNSNPQNIISGRNENTIKLEKGVYYIKLSPVYLGEDIRELKVKLLDEYDFSDNTTWQNAGIVTLGKEAKIAVNAENDVDWFKFNVDSDSQIKINLQGTGSNSKSLKYYIYNESTISQSNPAAVASGTVSTNNGTIGAKLSKGNYYIKLQPNGSNDYMEEPIKLVIYKDGNDVTRPTITGKTPTGNNVDAYSNIEVTFSRPMNTSTLTKDNIKVKCYNEEIDFDIEWVEGTNKLVLKPKNRLNFSSEYTVEISNNVKADNGYTLLKSYSWGFNTREKRTTDDLVGTISGSVKLTDNLQGLAVATTIEVYSGTKKVKTAYPDRYGKFVINNIPEGTYRVWAKLPGFLDVSKEVKVTAYNDTSIQLSPIYGDLNDDDIIDIFDISGLSTQYDKKSQ